MRLLYIDIDTLRPDHLGCYGYHRATSPNIDSLAARGVRFENVYASDTPCLPSRSALIAGRFGIRNGVVGHGGAAAEPFREGADRGFWSKAAMTSWANRFRSVGMRTTSISTFAERHSAYHWLAGFNESLNVGQMGMETADVVSEAFLDWIGRRAAADDWFCHVHLWDPHTPYRAPAACGDPFADEPLPAWYTEEVRSQHWSLPGPHSAQEMAGFGARRTQERFPRQPTAATGMDDVRAMFDGYDTGVRYADDHIGRWLNALADVGVLEETAVMVSSDHGETLGELGTYATTTSPTSTPATCRWSWCGPGSPVRRAERWQAASTTSSTWPPRSPSWSARPRRSGRRHRPPRRVAGPAPVGREHLVMSQACGRPAGRADGGLALHRTRHDAYHGLPEEMLFDVVSDPHEEHDLAAHEPEVCRRAEAQLVAWREAVLGRTRRPVSIRWTRCWRRAAPGTSAATCSSTPNACVRPDGARGLTSSWLATPASRRRPPSWRLLTRFADHTPAPDVEGSGVRQPAGGASCGRSPSRSGSSDRWPRCRTSSPTWRTMRTWHRTAASTFRDPLSD